MMAREPSVDTSPRRRREDLRAVGVALVAFVLCAAAIRPLVPLPDDFVISDKLTWYAQHAERYDTVVVGSSRTYRGFIPEVLERRLAGLGRPARVFNMGGPGLGGYEQEWVIERVLAHGAGHLTRVIIEERGWSTHIPPWNRRTQRAVVWHDPLTTLHVLAACLRHPADDADRLELVRMHGDLGARWLGNYGQGWRIVRDLLGRRPEPRMTPAELEQHAGWRSLEAEVGHDLSVEQRRERFREVADEYQLALRMLRIENQQPGDTTRYDRAALSRQVDSIRAAGADVVHVLPPGLESTPTAFALEAEGAFPLLIAFNHPHRYTTLYRPDRRFDTEHLAENGAAELSALFGVALHERLEPRED